ncbi:MAG: heme-binding protein [Acidobacteriota bacterium]|nr:heme-binding protein [Blastocatellia bacterium]MDW8239573.1 heme-binding protein [Acidobacteriota bacterium]
MKRTLFTASLVIIALLLAEKSRHDAQTGSPILTASDVQQLIGRAARALADPTMVIAVTDRAGRILGVFRKPQAPQLALGNFGRMVNANDLAVALARTGAFFSNDQAPLSSRTVRFISGIHFPPGIAFTPNAALYGIENTNRGCPLDPELDTLIPRARALDGGFGLGIITGKADLLDTIPYPDALNPGGIPIFKQGRVVGGIGVVLGARGERVTQAELVAFTAACPFIASALPLPSPGVIFLDGIRLPFAVINGQELPPIPSSFQCPAGSTVDVSNFPQPGEGSYVVMPRDGGIVPDGWLLGPRDGLGLTRDEVRRIIQQAVERAERTRAAIRLPAGSRARFVIAVGDVSGRMLGVFRMADATVFSIDVAVTKARNVVYFSSSSVDPRDMPGVPPGTAVTNRTISFGAQPLYPPGIGPGRGPFDPTAAGPFFDLYQRDTNSLCTQGHQPPNASQSGVVFFPGAVPLYRDGQLIGGLGISGDGVEQDDYVAAAGAVGFEPPAQIRADNVIVRGVRLPYLKFPRNPER